MSPFKTLYQKACRPSSLLARLAVFSALALMITACVPGGGGDGGGSASSNCDPSALHHHHHSEWGDGDGRVRHYHEYDQGGFHHEEWDDNLGKHHHVWCDDKGNHNHDWDDAQGFHHHYWCDDRGHSCQDWDDREGHHHQGDDDSSHTNYNTSTSTSTSVDTAQPCPVSTSTSTSTSTSSSTATATYAFPVLPGRSCSVDTFFQPTVGSNNGGGQEGGGCSGKLDVLFVVDHSSSMANRWTPMAQNINKFVQQLPDGTDVRYGVVLADVGVWSGRMYAPFGAAYLDGQDLSMAQVSQGLQEMFTAAMSVNDAAQGQAALYSLNQAITVHAAENQRLGFFRADAGLTVIFVSDKNDIGSSVPGSCGLKGRCDASFCGGIKGTFYDNHGIDSGACYNNLRRLKGDMPLQAHAFVNVNENDVYVDESANFSCHHEMIGYGYTDVVSRCGGVVYSIHQDPGSGLAQCGQSSGKGLQLQHNFTLSHPASQVDAATILSAVDNSLQPGTYTATSDSDYLANAGKAGSEIQIRYCAPVVAPIWTLSGFAGVPSQTTVGLGWQTSPAATSGKVMWGTSAASLTNEVDDPANAANHAVTVSGLTPNTTYYFQAISADSAGNQQSSAVISVTTLPAWSIANVVAQAGSTNATIQWATPAYPTSGYVNWGLSATALTNQVAAAAVASSQSVAVSGLQPSTTYYYQVVASDAFGQSESSAVLSFTTEAVWGITGFTGAASENSVTLLWQTPEQVTTGAILWGATSALGSTVNEGTAAANNHSVTVSGLSPETSYYFQVKATDPAGNVEISNVIVLETTAGWAIAGFAGTSTDSSVTVSWTTAGYNTSGTVAWGLSATTLGTNVADTVNGQSHSVTVNGLSPSTTYYFQASSTDSNSLTQSSAVVAITTAAAPLPTWSISNFAGTSTTSTVTVSWQTTQYATSGTVLWGSSASALSNSVSDTVVGTSHSVTISGLSPGTTYYFQAVASDDAGQTQNSSVIPVVTMNTVVTPPANWTIVGFDGTTTGTAANLIWQTPGALTTAVVSVGLSTTDLSLQSVSVTTPADTQTAVVSGLNTNTTYYFQVTATDSSGNTVQSPIISKTTKAQ